MGVMHLFKFSILYGEAYSLRQLFTNTHFNFLSIAIKCLYFVGIITVVDIALVIINSVENCRNKLKGPYSSKIDILSPKKDLIN